MNSKKGRFLLAIIAIAIKRVNNFLGNPLRTIGMFRFIAGLITPDTRTKLNLLNFYTIEIYYDGNVLRKYRRPTFDMDPGYR